MYKLFILFYLFHLFISENIDELEQEDSQYEEEAGGLVTRKVWMTYFKVGGIFPGMTYVFAALGCQALRVYTDLWLSRWTEQNGHHDYSNDSHQNVGIKRTSITSRSIKFRFN